MTRSTEAFLARLTREIRRGILPVWILEELGGGPAYGYALLERLKVQHGGEVSVTPSTLYPTLARLRTAGLVRSFHGRTSLGPLRKYYELTDAGRDLLPSLRALWAQTAAMRSPSMRRQATSSEVGG